MARAKNKPIPQLSPADLERFYSKVPQSMSDACWEWRGTRCPIQKSPRTMWYGILGVTVEGAQIPYLAHRIAFFLATGQDPKDQLVMHSCDNPPCCNPAHLLLGTNAMNAADMAHKKRSTRGWKFPNKNALRGSRNVLAKLTEDLVEEIRLRRADHETCKAITQSLRARGLSITNPTVAEAARGKTWTHVQTPSVPNSRGPGAVLISSRLP